MVCGEPRICSQGVQRHSHVVLQRLNWLASLHLFQVRPDIIDEAAAANGDSHPYRPPLSKNEIACPPATAFQLCDWYSEPADVGKLLHLLPLGGWEEDYPLPCGPGLLGSTDPSSQSAPLCGGYCPAGTCAPPLTRTLVLLDGPNHLRLL